MCPAIGVKVKYTKEQFIRKILILIHRIYKENPTQVRFDTLSAVYVPRKITAEEKQNE